ncbi:MAG: penicillin-binding transpeptidase domain-containing protein [Acidobacteriota bacterium]
MTDPGLLWRVRMKRRLLAVVIFLAVWATGIEARLVYLQLAKHDDYVALLGRQQLRTRPTPAKRGDIFDRHGRLLATSIDVDSVVAIPSAIANAKDTVAKLCRVFGDCTGAERADLVARLEQANQFANIRRQVSAEQARRVLALNLDGIGFIKESRRFYPNQELAAHVLGYVGVDGNGLAGVESTYDSQIRGKAGRVLVQVDAKRRAYARSERPATTGSNVELTIDEYLQHVTEQALHEGVIENRAAGGTAIVMNPHTGEILAMASEPTFDPNEYADSEDVERRNRAVQDIYEPGSTFKTVTAAAAIEEGVMPIDTLIDTNPGYIKIDSSRIVRDTKNHGVISFIDVIVESSNVGAIKIGFKVGPGRLSQYVQRFGFGRRVSPDFPGESAGIVWNADKWTDSALASVSMGYQIGVTPLQMASAVSAVANGGTLVQPRIVRAFYRDNVRRVVEPKVLRRVITADTAATLTSIMEGVVERGTATPAKIAGYTVAGKTGTAAKLVNGHYSKSDYNGSFIGFLPSRDPVVTILVVLDSPHGPHGYYGGNVSAPIFKRIAESTLRYLGIGRTIDPAPPVLVNRHDAGIALPPPAIALVTNEQSTPAGTVPDLYGMSARDAVRKLVRLGADVRLSGDGFVTAQVPAAGTVLEPGTVCRLALSRWASRVDRGQP